MYRFSEAVPNLRTIALPEVAAQIEGDPAIDADGSVV
jgi:hypothetical protein